MECTCGTTKKFHLASCESIQKRDRQVLYKLYSEASILPETKYYYIALDPDSSFNVYNHFVNNLQESDWLFTLSANGSGSVMLNNGSEIIFIPVEDAIHLTGIENADHIYIESDNATKDLMETLSPYTHNMNIVDPITHEIL